MCGVYRRLTEVGGVFYGSLGIMCVYPCAYVYCIYVSHLSAPAPSYGSLGIAHRDLKPENLMYKSHDVNSPDYDTVKVTDFGLANWCVRVIALVVVLATGGNSDCNRFGARELVHDSDSTSDSNSSHVVVGLVRVIVLVD